MAKKRKKKKQRLNKADFKQKQAIQARQREARRAAEAEAKRAHEAKRKAEQEAKRAHEAKLAEARAQAASPPEKDADEIAREERYEEFHAEQEYEARIALLFKTMDEGLLDEESAFDMMDTIYQQSTKFSDEGRERFNSLAATLRERFPDIYANDAEFYTDWLVTNAFATNSLDKLPALADEVASIIGEELDTFYNISDRFAYYQQLDLIVQMMRKGYPDLQEQSANYFDGVVEDFLSKAIDHELFAYLEEKPTAHGLAPILRQRIESYQHDDIRWAQIERSLSYMSGQAGKEWTLADFALDEDLSGDDFDPEDEEMSDNLLNFTTQFLHYLRSAEDVGYAKGELARQGIHKYILERNAGELVEQESMFERLANPNRKRKEPKQVKPIHLFVPDPQTLNVYFGSRMTLFNPQYYAVAATYELLPAWLRYLESNNFISAKLRQDTINRLAGMKGSMSTVWEHYDPKLQEGLEHWG